MAEVTRANPPLKKNLKGLGTMKTKAQVMQIVAQTKRCSTCSAHRRRPALGAPERSRTLAESGFRSHQWNHRSHVIRIFQNM